MDLTLTAFNCNGLERSLPYVMDLSQKHQVTFVCEHWLQLSELHTINEAVTQEGMWCHLKSSMDPLQNRKGRPFGGIGFICDSKSLAYGIIECQSECVLYK